MKAVTQDRYGSPDVLQVEEIDEPTPKEGEVRLRVQAASVNAGDWHLMRGIPYLIRVMGFGLRRPTQRVLGQDVAGVVEAVGEGVTRWKVGDEVFGFGAGTFAERVCVPETQLLARPEHLSAAQAATLPVAGITALNALRDQAKLEAGQSVLVLGASGGVGSFTVLLAKAMGAEVTGVCGTHNVERVRSLGADEVIDYSTQDATQSGKRFDGVVRVSGPYRVGACRRVLAPRGTLVLVGGGRMGRWLGGMERFLGTMLLNLVTRQRLKPFVSMANADHLAALGALVAEHRIEPLIERTLPLDEAARALQHVGDGHARGKVVLET